MPRIFQVTNLIGDIVGVGDVSKYECERHVYIDSLHASASVYMHQ